MVDIPSNNNVIKNRKINTQMRTETPGGPTARANFAVPYTAGDAAVKTVNNLSKMANTIADEQAYARAKQKGFDEQTAVGGTQFTGKDSVAPAFTITGKALQEGRSVAYINAKKNELEELKLIGEKNPNNAEAYQLAADEYKTKWLENVPSFMTSQMSQLFDEKNTIVGNQVQAREIQGTIQKNIAEVDERLSKDLNAVYGMFRDANVSNEDIVARVIEITDHLNIDYPKVQASQGHLRKNQKLVSKFIKMSIAEKEWLNASPEKRKQLMEAAQMGKLEGGETGEAFSSFFKNGLELTVEEQKELVQLFDGLEKDFTASNELAINQNNSNFESTIKDIKNGKGFALTSTQDSGDYSVVFRQQEVFDFDDYADNWKRLGKDDQFIAQKKQEFEFAYEIAEATRKGNIFPIGSSQGADYIATLQSQIAELEKSNTDDITKGTYKRLLEDKIDAFRETQTAKEKALADPNTNLADYLIDQGVVRLSTPDKAGLDMLNYELSVLTNTPLNVSESLPAAIVNQVKGNLNKTSGLEQMQSLDQVVNNIGENHTISALQDIVKTSDATQDDAKLAIFGIVDRSQQEYAFSTGIEFDNNLTVLLDKFEDKNTVTTVKNQIMSDVNDVFEDGGALDFVGNSLQKESLKGLVATVYADKLKRNDPEVAMQQTVDFITSTHYVGELTDNTTIIASKRDIPNDQEFSKYRGAYNAFLNDPIGHGARSATSDKIQDLLTDLDEQKVYVTHNGIQVVDNDTGRELFFQKIPNATGRNIYSEMAIQPYNTRESITLQDKDHMGSAQIKYDHNTFNENFDPLTEPLETMDIEGPTTERLKKNLDDKAREAVISFFTLGDKNLRIEAGTTDDEPLVFFNKQTGEQIDVETAKQISSEFDARQNAVNLEVINELDRPGSIDNLVLAVINHAVVVNQLQPWMLDYMAENITYTQKLQDRFTKQAVFDQIKNNHASFVNGIPLKGSNGGVHSGLSWLTTTVREIDEQDLEKYRPAPVEVDAEGA